MNTETLTISIRHNDLYTMICFVSYRYIAHRYHHEGG